MKILIKQFVPLVIQHNALNIFKQEITNDSTSNYRMSRNTTEFHLCLAACFFFHWIYIHFKLPIKAPFYSINFITSVTQQNLIHASNNIYHLTPPISGPPRLLPIASISSIKMIEGANDLAFAKRSLTREAATPTNIWKSTF